MRSGCVRASGDASADFRGAGRGSPAWLRPRKEAFPCKAIKLSFEGDLTGRFGIEDHESEDVLGVLLEQPRQGGEREVRRDIVPTLTLSLCSRWRDTLDVTS